MEVDKQYQESVKHLKGYMGMPIKVAKLTQLL